MQVVIFQGQSKSLAKLSPEKMAEAVQALVEDGSLKREHVPAKPTAKELLDLIDTVPIRLGRFDRVSKGQVLVLTDPEWADVSKDPRFTLSKDPEKATVEQTETAAAIQLRGKTAAELHAIVEELRKEGKTVDLPESPKKADLVKAIEAAHAHSVPPAE